MGAITEIKKSVNLINALILFAGDRSFFIDVKNVNCVVDLVEMQPAVDEPEYIVGYIDFHGEVIPVLDLASRLGLEKNDYYNLNTPMVICNFQKQYYGIICDHVDKIISVDESSYSFVEKSEKSFFEKVIFFEGEMIFKIDLKLFFSIGGA